MDTCAAIADVNTSSKISRFLLSRPAVLAISAVGMLSVDSIAPPRKVVRSDPRRAVPRAFVRSARRTRRRSTTDDDDGGEGCSGDWDNRDDGSFGGGGGGSGGGGGGGRGRWWNFDGRGGSDWGEWGSSSASSDPAFDVVYGVICCIALYSCTGFAFKRICRFLANKEKVTLLRLLPHFSP